MSETITASWRRRADELHKRANELGDCRAGLEAFTEACTLRECAAAVEQLVPPGWLGLLAWRAGLCGEQS
jgi:hypothetical protein